MVLIFSLKFDSRSYHFWDIKENISLIFFGRVSMYSFLEVYFYKHFNLFTGSIGFECLVKEDQVETDVWLQLKLVIIEALVIVSGVSNRT